MTFWVGFITGIAVESLLRFLLHVQATYKENERVRLKREKH